MARLHDQATPIPETPPLHGTLTEDAHGSVRPSLARVEMGLPTAFGQPHPSYPNLSLIVDDGARLPFGASCILRGRRGRSLARRPSPYSSRTPKTLGQRVETSRQHELVEQSAVPVGPRWIRALAARSDPMVTESSVVTREATRSGALLFFCGQVVVKVHARRTNRSDLQARLATACHPDAQPWLLAPLFSDVLSTPDQSRCVTVWPTVDVVDPESPDHPWQEGAALLAGLHRTDPPFRLPDQGGRHRLTRWLKSLMHARIRTSEARFLVKLGTLLAERAAAESTDRPRLVHGDWHLGQMGCCRRTNQWRLIDIDDLGLGDPAWDLGRPAGFWAAGLLGDDAWDQFLNNYREEGGPGVPVGGDSWRSLDLPARCAVFVAATRLVLEPDVAGDGDVRALLAACHRMTP